MLLSYPAFHICFDESCVYCDVLSYEEQGIRYPVLQSVKLLKAKKHMVNRANITTRVWFSRHDARSDRHKLLMGDTHLARFIYLSMEQSDNMKSQIVTGE